jgi:hypothetical protein
MRECCSAIGNQERAGGLVDPQFLSLLNIASQVIGCGGMQWHQSRLVELTVENLKSRWIQV